MKIAKNNKKRIQITKTQQNY